METTWSLSSRPETSTLSMRWLRGLLVIALEPQPALAGGVGQRLDPAVVLEAAAIEDHAVDALGLGSSGDELAHRLGGGQVGAALELRLQLLVQATGGAQ